MKRRLPAGWGFALPGVALVIVVIGVPLGMAAAMAVSSLTFLHNRMRPFVGFRHFADALADPMFWRSLQTTVIYAAATVTGEFVLGLAAALLLQRVVRLRAVYFALLTIPLAMSPVSVGLVWRMLLQPNLGIVNTLIAAAGLPPPDWLGSSDLAFWTVVGVDIWQQVSFVILLLAAGLAALPREPFEAAQVDGAGALARFWFVTLPLLRPVAVITLIIQLINEARTYDLIYVMTRGGPGVSTDVLSFAAYRRAFLGLQLDEGAAIAFLLLLLVLTVTVALFVATRRS